MFDVMNKDVLISIIIHIKIIDFVEKVIIIVNKNIGKITKFL